MKIFFSQLPLFLSLSGLLLFVSCEKVIDIDPPNGSTGIVIEGSIENGRFPLVIVSRSQLYFTPISSSLAALAEVLVDSAEVYIEVDGTEYMLDRICLSNLPPELQAVAQAELGLAQLPPGFDICIYASLNEALVGVVGKTYNLRVVVDGNEYTSSTRIPELVDLDSLWFDFDINIASDTFGYIWTRLRDPDTLGNNYRIWTKRLGRDNGFRAVSSGFDDRFFNGQRFEFLMGRDDRFGDPEEANGDERGRYRAYDTVVVKTGTMNSDVLRFWNTARAATSAGFNPFASPVTVMSNIRNGGRGVWGGYGVTYDTVICIPPQ